ncbi:hypothetical protein F4860DRAFT_52914 [Xylaria cubensis]|nr:hypothetical protein F4860DRAFT_52914 [Xylaria cubensis]
MALAFLGIGTFQGAANAAPLFNEFVIHPKSSGPAWGTTIPLNQQQLNPWPSCSYLELRTHFPPSFINSMKRPDQITRSILAERHTCEGRACIRVPVPALALCCVTTINISKSGNPKRPAVPFVYLLPEGTRLCSWQVLAIVVSWLFDE